MDPVTHALTGATIKQFGFSRKAALGVLVLASLAPDLDYITRLWGVDVFLRYHRGITHGFLALIIASVVIGLAFGYRKGFWYYSLLAFLGYGVHLLMDLTNQYGTRVLSPLDWEPYSLDITFIIDPYVTLGLLLCVILGRFNRKRSRLIAAVTIVMLISHFGIRFYLHNKTEEFLRARIDAHTYKVCPLPNDFLRWWFVCRSGEEYIVGFADLFAQRYCIQDRYRVTRDPLIERSKNERLVKNFLSFAKYPFAETRKEGETSVVLWRELSYAFRAGEHFVAQVVYDKNGKVISSGFRF